MKFSVVLLDLQFVITICSQTFLFLSQFSPNTHVVVYLHTRRGAVLGPGDARSQGGGEPSLSSHSRARALMFLSLFFWQLSFLSQRTLRLVLFPSRDRI